MGLLGYWVVLLLRAMVVHPAESILASPISGECCCLQDLVIPRPSELPLFGAAFPRPIRSLAYASPVALPPPSQG